MDHHNQVHLRSAIGYVTPLAKLERREAQIFAERDRKLEAAQRQRQLRRQEAQIQPSQHSGDSSAAVLNRFGRAKRKPALGGRNRAEG